MTTAAIGQSGEKLKPMMDRVREMVDIIIRVISTAQGLSPGTNPLALPYPDENDE
jgi:hypothetical protein